MLISILQILLGQGLLKKQIHLNYFIWLIFIAINNFSLYILYNSYGSRWIFLSKGGPLIELDNLILLLILIIFLSILLIPLAIINNNSYFKFINSFLISLNSLIFKIYFIENNFIFLKKNNYVIYKLPTNQEEMISFINNEWLSITKEKSFEVWKGCYENYFLWYETMGKLNISFIEKENKILTWSEYFIDNPDDIFTILFTPVFFGALYGLYLFFLSGWED